MCSSALAAPGSACRDHKPPCTALGPRVASAKGSMGTTGLPQFARKEMIPGGNHGWPQTPCCGGHLGGLGQGGCRTVLTCRHGAGHCSLLRVSLKWWNSLCAVPEANPLASTLWTSLSAWRHRSTRVFPLVGQFSRFCSAALLIQ